MSIGYETAPFALPASPVAADLLAKLLPGAW